MRSIRHLPKYGAAALACLLLAAACTEDAAPPPYEEQMFGGTELCEEFAAEVPDGFYQDGIAFDLLGGSESCDVRQVTGTVYLNLGFNVFLDQTSAWPKYTAKIFNENTGDGSIPVDGLGEAAALVSGHGAGFDGMYLWVQEDNLAIEFQAYSGNEVDGIGLRTVPLTTSVAASVVTAEWFLEHFDVEPREAQTTEDGLESGTTALPDLCGQLDIDGMEPAAVEPEASEFSDVLSHCHWAGAEDAELWLTAEAVAPLDLAEMSAEEFAAWWTTSTPEATGDPLDLGDEAYVLEVDADTNKFDDIEIPATDFVIRIGNIVLQGRYQEGTTSGRPNAEILAASIAEQVPALLQEQL